MDWKVETNQYQLFQKLNKKYKIFLSSMLHYEYKIPRILEPNTTSKLKKYPANVWKLKYTLVVYFLLSLNWALHLYELAILGEWEVFKE